MKNIKDELLNADDMTKQWPKWELVSALGFPSLAKNSLCKQYWSEQKTVTLREIFELVISSEKDRRPGYLITTILDMRCIGITSYFKMIKSMSEANFGKKCNAIWQVKYARYLAAKRVRGKIYSYSKPIVR